MSGDLGVVSNCTFKTSEMFSHFLSKQTDSNVVFLVGFQIHVENIGISSSRCDFTRLFLKRTTKPLAFWGLV